MNREIALKWAEALESGEYKQAVGRLARHDSHCCLGVLCEVAIKAGVQVTKTKTVSGFLYDDDSGALPASVQDWAETADDPYIGGWSASHWNDNVQLSFPAIAALIRKEVGQS